MYDCSLDHLKKITHSPFGCFAKVSSPLLDICNSLLASTRFGGYERGNFSGVFAVGRLLGIYVDTEYQAKDMHG